MSLVVAGVLGVGTWSLLEYVIHRWMGHERAFMKRWYNFFGGEHTRHHSEGDYFAPPWKKALAALALVPVVTGLVGLVVGTTLAAAYAVGFVGFYLTYEWLHLRLHTHEALTPYGRWARKHHFAHHFHNPSHNHGVTSPIWDWVFGTLDRVQVVRVPERLQMRWLCDPATGEVWERHRAEWELRRAKRKREAA